jgi:predicted ribosomally synthesized peptide with SipW-like signal peptide
MKLRKILTLTCAIGLTAALAIGGTLAYLTAQTDTVTNTFTVGNVTITLDEAKTDTDGKLIKVVNEEDTTVDKIDDATRITTGNKYKLVPGRTYTKDPTIQVDKTSEACWLFVKVTDPNNSITVTEDGKAVTLEDIVGYTVADTENGGDWTAVPKKDGYWYVQVSADDIANGTKYAVLKDNEITISGDLDTTMSEQIDTNVKADSKKTPSIEILAAAVQSEGVDDVNAAWNALPTEFTNPTTTTTTTTGGSTSAENT